MNFITLQWLEDNPHRNQKTMSYFFNPMVYGRAIMLSCSPLPEILQNFLTAGVFAVCTYIADCCSIGGGFSTWQPWWEGSHLRWGLQRSQCWFLLKRMLEFPMYSNANKIKLVLRVLQRPGSAHESLEFLFCCLSLVFKSHEFLQRQL